MNSELKAYLDKLRAETRALYDEFDRKLQLRAALPAKPSTGAPPPPPTRSGVVASDGGISIDTTIPAVVPDAFSATTQAQEPLAVAHDAAPVCIATAPVTCSTEYSTQVDAIVRVDEAHEAATTVRLELVVDLIHKEVEQLAPVQATDSIPSPTTPTRCSTYCGTAVSFPGASTRTWLQPVPPRPPDPRKLSPGAWPGCRPEASITVQWQYEEDMAPVSNMLMLNGNHSTSPGCLIGNVLCSPSGIYLDTKATLPMFPWNPGPAMLPSSAVLYEEWVLPPWDSGQQADASYDQLPCAVRNAFYGPRYFVTGGHMHLSPTCSNRRLLLIGFITSVPFLNLAQFLVQPTKQHGELFYVLGLYLAKSSGIFSEFQNWLPYMLQHWNSCRPESVMTGTIFQVPASEPIPTTFQVFVMSLETALNQAAIGQGVLLILTQYDALRYSDLWSLTTDVLTEIVNMFNTHPSAGVRSKLASAVSADYPRDVSLLFSMYPTTSAVSSGYHLKAPNVFESEQEVDCTSQMIFNQTSIADGQHCPISDALRVIRWMFRYVPWEEPIHYFPDSEMQLECTVGFNYGFVVSLIRNMTSHQSDKSSYRWLTQPNVQQYRTLRNTSTKSGQRWALYISTGFSQTSLEEFFVHSVAGYPFSCRQSHEVPYVLSALVLLLLRYVDPLQACCYELILIDELFRCFHGTLNTLSGCPLHLKLCTIGLMSSEGTQRLQENCENLSTYACYLCVLLMYSSFDCFHQSAQLKNGRPQPQVAYVMKHLSSARNSLREASNFLTYLLQLKLPWPSFSNTCRAVQVHWKISEHQAHEHAAVCSIPTPDHQPRIKANWKKCYIILHCRLFWSLQWSSKPWSSGHLASYLNSCSISVTLNCGHGHLYVQLVKLRAAGIEGEGFGQDCTPCCGWDLGAEPRNPEDSSAQFHIVEAYKPNQYGDLLVLSCLMAQHVCVLRSRCNLNWPLPTTPFTNEQQLLGCMSSVCSGFIQEVSCSYCSPTVACALYIGNQSPVAFIPSARAVPYVVAYTRCMKRVIEQPWDPGGSSLSVWISHSSDETERYRDMFSGSQQAGRFLGGIGLRSSRISRGRGCQRPNFHYGNIAPKHCHGSQNCCHGSQSSKPNKGDQHMGLARPEPSSATSYLSRGKSNEPGIQVGSGKRQWRLSSLSPFFYLVSETFLL